MYYCVVPRSQFATRTIVAPKTTTTIIWNVQNIHLLSFSECVRDVVSAYNIVWAFVYFLFCFPTIYIIYCKRSNKMDIIVIIAWGVLWLLYEWTSLEMATSQFLSRKTEYACCEMESDIHKVLQRFALWHLT